MDAFILKCRFPETAISHHGYGIKLIHFSFVFGRRNSSHGHDRDMLLIYYLIVFVDAPQQDLML